MKPSKNRRVLIAGLALFTLLLVTVNGIFFYQDSLGDDFWGGTEAPTLRMDAGSSAGAQWFFDVQAGKLICPKFIGTSQTANLGLEFVNSSNSPQKAIVQVFISAPQQPNGLTKIIAEYPVEPKSSAIATWQVGPENLGQDGTIRARIYSGNKAGNAYGEARLCTIRSLQIGPLSGNSAGYTLIALLLLGFWAFWAALNKTFDFSRMDRGDRDAWRVFAIVLTLVTLVNLFSAGLGMRLVNLFAILVVAVFVLRPTQSLQKVN